MNLSDFRTRHPEFTAALVADPVVTVYLADAALYIGPRFEDFAEVATGYLVAHWCQLWLNSQAANPALLNSGDVVSRSGGHGISFSRSGAAVDAQQSDPFLKTAYGQQFAALRDRCGQGAMAVGQSFSDPLGIGVIDQ
jgi:hypothetical protein